MPTTFNKGKAFHGSEAVMDGRLAGRTDTDYFYFFCPKCDGEEILQILDYAVISNGPVSYAVATRPSAKRDFILAFELQCIRCGHHDFVKVGNVGWQGGSFRRATG